MSEHAAPPPTPTESWEVLDLLTALIQKSLVVYEEDEDGQGRYHLLETVRQYARDRLLEGGEGEAVRERHGECFLQLAEAACAAAGHGQGAETFERLEGEHDNLRAALAWSDGRKAERALRLAGALGEFWFERGYWDEGRQWLESALAAVPDAEPTAERARALAAAGRLATFHPDDPAAPNRLEQSIALYRVLGDARGLVETLTYRSDELRCQGNAAVARVVQEESVELARTLGDPRLLAMALCELGWVTTFGEDPQTARVVLEESLALARQVGDRGLMSRALQRLGPVVAGQGEGPKARELLEESVELARAAKNKSFLFWALLSLGEVLSRQGDPEQAKSLPEEALLLARELRSPHLIGWAIRRLVEHGLPYEKALLIVQQAAAEYGPEVVRLALGALVARAPSYEEALRRIDQAAREYSPEVVRGALEALVVRAPSYEEALQMVEQAAAEYGPEVVRRAHGALVVRAPSYEEALRRIDRAAREYGPEGAIHPLAALGHAARERGDYEWAATFYRRSLVLRQERGVTFAIAQSLEDFAGLAARQQQWERAATLLGAAEGLCAELRRTRPVANVEEHKRAVRGARAALGEEAFAAAWAEGRALSLADAVALALEAGGAEGALLGPDPGADG